jgi:hypothetical protein
MIPIQSIRRRTRAEVHTYIESKTVHLPGLTKLKYAHLTSCYTVISKVVRNLGKLTDPE